LGAIVFAPIVLLPAVKGREQSRPLSEIIEEVKGYIDREVKEIVLLGQNINHYGYDLGNKMVLSNFLRQLIKLKV